MQEQVKFPGPLIHFCPRFLQGLWFSHSFMSVDVKLIINLKRTLINQKQSYINDQEFFFFLSHKCLDSSCLENRNDILLK